MTLHIHEDWSDDPNRTKIGLICLLKEGKPAGSSVAFEVFHDGVKTADLTGSVVADARARAGKAATAEYFPPRVPDDKTHYIVTYKAVADGETYLGGQDIHVWPRKGKLTSRNEDDSKPLKNFKFKAVQAGVVSTDIYKAEGDDPATAEFRLAAGLPFTLEGVAPYAIVGTPEPQGGKLRDLKSKNKVTFVAEFVKPLRPAPDGKIRQWVNLDTEAGKVGTDGLGSAVEVTVGVQGDRDAGGTTKAEPLGMAGLFVHVKVKFSGPAGRKSLRNTPKTDLVAGLQLVDRTAVKEADTDPEWEYTGRIDLSEAGGVGKFKLELGSAGGDTCVVSIGSTPACGEAAITFTNWRKIWYELMAPTAMALEAGAAEDGTAVRDFPAAIRGGVKASGDPTFVEYRIYRSQSFTDAEALAACPGSLLPSTFFRRAGPARTCYVLTDHTFAQYPKTFDRGKSPRGTLIKACDVNLFCDGPGKDDDVLGAPDFTTDQADLDFSGTETFWSPTSAWAGGNADPAIRSLTWAARLTPATYRGRARHTFVATVDDDTLNAGGDDQVFRIDELLQGTSCTVTFKAPRIGNTPSSLDATARAAIDAWLPTLWTDDKVRPHGFALQFRITGRLGNPRRQARAQSISDHIAATMNTAPLLYRHPALQPDGAPRSGTLVVNDVVDMARSHWQRIAVNLPTDNPDDPGNLAGAASDTKCPIRVTFTFEPQHVGLGLAGQGAQQGELLLDLDPAAPVSVSDTALHEIAHLFGLSNVAHGLPGLPPGKAFDETETIVRYRTNGRKGHLYIDHEHSGGHCAYGLSDAEKTDSDFRSKPGRCIMFGEAGRNDTTRRTIGFCPQCQDHIRAQDLSACL